MITGMQADRLEGATRLKRVADELAQAWSLSCFSDGHTAELQAIKVQVEKLFAELIPNESPANKRRR